MDKTIILILLIIILNLLKNVYFKTYLIHLSTFVLIDVKNFIEY